MDQTALDEIQKLKKRIRDLEDENDDLQDELDDKESELKKINKTCEVQTEALSNDLLNLQKELKERDEKLDEWQQSFNLKNESLSFIQAILSAKEYSSENMEELYKNINNFYNFVDEDLYQFIINHYELDDDWKKEYKNNLQLWTISKIKSWISGKTSIAFIGEFSAGKTSIVNRILSQDDPSVPRLPVSTKATTAIPTYISGTDIKTEYLFFTPNNELKIIAPETFSKVTKEILEQTGGVSNLIKYFVLAYKNPNLRNLSILDTPGFNSNDEEDAKRTIDVINECDALYWVVDVNAGEINKSSLNLIKENLNKPLYVVVNKTDTKSPHEVLDVINRIGKNFEREGVTVEDIIQFNQNEPLNKLMNSILSVKKVSEEEDFIDIVKGFINDIKENAEKDLKETDKTLKETKKNFESLQDTFINNTKILEGNCEYASQIIRSCWSEHILRDDQYDVSKEAGDALIDTVENCIAGNNIEVLKENCSDIIDAAGSLEQIYEAYNNALQTKKIANELEDRFRQLVKKIN